MDKKLAGVLGAAAFSALGAAHATTPSADVLRANSYAELLNPVPNAVAELIADDARAAETAKPSGQQLAQMHDHHHHHRYHRRVIVVPRRHRHHHHHHHHHSHYMAVPKTSA